MPARPTTNTSSPGGETTARHPFISVRVSDDGMHAHLIYSPPAGGGMLAVTGDQLLGILRGNQIAVDDAVRARISDYVQGLVDPARCVQLARDPFLIAHGRLPIEATDPFMSPPEDGTIDPAALEAFPAGAIVGHLVHGQHGIPGVTVFGTAISPQRPLGKPFRLGDGLRVDETKNDAVVTTRPGLLVQEGDLFKIVKLTAIEGDAGSPSTSVDCPTDVRIRGSVKGGARVRSARSIVVEGQIYGGSASSQHRLIVHGGIYGAGSRQRIHAGGWARTTVCEDVLLLCDSGLEIAQRLAGCDTMVRGGIEMSTGAIVGGTTWAREGMTVHTLGCESGLDTLIGVGAPPWFIQRRGERGQLLARHQDQAKSLRTKLAPLVANMTRLNVHQREQLTHLLCRCEQIEELVRTSSCEGKTEDSIFQPSHPARIQVEGVLHPGVRIRMGIVEVRITETVEGPLSIFERTAEDGSNGIFIRTARGEIAPLHAMPIAPEVLRAEAARMLPPIADMKPGSAEH